MEDNKKQGVSPNDRFGEEVSFDLMGTTTLGKITYAFMSGSNIKYYHIRTDDGREWQRHDGEFQPRKK